MAAEALLEILQGEAHPPQKLVIEPVLEVRASCGAIQRPPDLLPYDPAPSPITSVGSTHERPQEA